LQATALVHEAWLRLVDDSIYHAARQFADPKQLSAYLDLACDGNPALRGRIENLLRATQFRDSCWHLPYVIVLMPIRGERLVALRIFAVSRLCQAMSFQRRGNCG